MIFQPIPIYPNKIKFFPNPAVYQWLVDRNSDVATDGAGNTGSLRYCMTNCAVGDIIVFAGILSDSANTGDIDTVVVTSSFPAKNFTIYGNGHYITIPPLSSFTLFNTNSIRSYIYSLHFRDFWHHSGKFGLEGLFNMEFHGCKFHRFSPRVSYYFTSSGTKLMNNCEMIDFAAFAYLNVLEYVKCNIISVSELNQGQTSMTDCYLRDCGLINNGSTSYTHSINRCFLDNCSIFYGGTTNIITNSIFIQRTTRLLAANAVANNEFTAYNNTIICIAAIDYLIGNTGTGSVINFKNNLVIAPMSTYILSQSVPSTVNESGNIYMCLNADAKLLNSTRHTGAVSSLIDMNMINKVVEGINRNYFNPKGAAINACAQAGAITTDYNGKQRSFPTDCGAIET